MIALLSLAALAAEPDVKSVEWARPFELTEAHQPNTPGSSPVSEGWIVELRVDPDKARAAAVAPALYAGTVAVYRTNWDHIGGCAVVIIPGDTDLATVPIYFGSSALPESADTDAELQAAVDRGVKPLPTAKAVSAGGDKLVAADLRDVYRAAADRIEICAPHEKGRADALR